MKFRKRPDALQGRVQGSLSKLKRDTFVGNFVSVGSRYRARHILELVSSLSGKIGTPGKKEREREAVWGEQALKVNPRQPRSTVRIFREVAFQDLKPL